MVLENRKMTLARWIGLRSFLRRDFVIVALVSDVENRQNNVS